MKSNFQTVNFEDKMEEFREEVKDEIINRKTALRKNI